MLCLVEQAPTSGVVKYTYARWFQPYSAHRRYCQLPVSGRNMKRFLQFRLGCHKLPIATGRRAGIVRASRQCTCCNAGALGDEMHLVFECASLAALRAKYADLFTSNTTTMRSFFAQSNHERFLLCHRLLEYDERIVIATIWHMRSDLLAGKILLLLLLPNDSNRPVRTPICTPLVTVRLICIRGCFEPSADLIR